ncbi:MAG TPA: histidine kinase [Burkholderiales bacterium]|nr:histidine kinase [Burkholderiales bacterium]
MWIGAASLAAIVVLIPVYRLQDLSWPHASAAAIIFVLTCVLLGWAVWRVLMRRLGSGSRGPGVAEHVLIGLLFSAAWTISFTAFVYLVRSEASLAFLRGGGIWQFVWGLVIYSALALTARIQQQLKERELAAAGAELQALRAQLDPHLLFNTLHSLTQLAREDPAATQIALERFGGLMRYVLNAGRDGMADVLLGNEIEFVRDYLAVERLRLGERLRVEEKIDADALEVAVPPLLLQPLVENAVRHGLAPRRDGGTIRLEAYIAGNRLAIEVGDDGNGAEPDILRRSTGLGLQAVRRQVSARFPGEGEFEVLTRPGAGFAVRIRIPARISTKGGL